MAKKRIVIPYCRHRVIDLLSYSPYPLEARCIMCNITLTALWIRPKRYTADHDTGYWVEEGSYVYRKEYSHNGQAH